MGIYFVLIVLLGIISIVLATISLVVSKLMRKDFAAKVSECILWWGLFPVVLPFRAKKLKVIRKNVYAWLLTLLSPLLSQLCLL